MIFMKTITVIPSEHFFTRHPGSCSKERWNRPTDRRGFKREDQSSRQLGKIALRRLWIVWRERRDSVVLCAGVSGDGQDLCGGCWWSAGVCGRLWLCCRTVPYDRRTHFTLRKWVLVMLLICMRIHRAVVRWMQTLSVVSVCFEGRGTRSSSSGILWVW